MAAQVKDDLKIIYINKTYRSSAIVQIDSFDQKAIILSEQNDENYFVFFLSDLMHGLIHSTKIKPVIPEIFDYATVTYGQHRGEYYLTVFLYVARSYLGLFFFRKDGHSTVRV